MSLVTKRNSADQDGAYAALIGAHKGLTAAESTAFNARLILILMNHVGDRGVIDQAIALAQASGGRAAG